MATSVYIQPNLAYTRATSFTLFNYTKQMGLVKAKRAGYSKASRF